MTSAQTKPDCELLGKLDWANSWLVEGKRIYIGGTLQEAQSAETFASINPATGEVLCRLPECGSEDVDQAVRAAKNAFAAWSKCNRRDRSKFLKEIGALIRTHKEELATLEALDNGKLYVEALNDDLPEAADVFDYYAGWTDKLYGQSCPTDEGLINYTRREPLGVCALIVPWNFPLLLACWKLAPALAMGNTVVVKPSPFTSLTLIRLCELINSHLDLPPGTINLVTGGATSGAALTSHMLVQKVSFTGSTSTGKQIVASSAASNLKSVGLELGGKSPNIVFDDVPDIDFAISRSFTAMFCHKGEKCSEPTRLFVHQKHYDRFVSEMSRMADAVVLGNPFHPHSQQGPQCYEEHMQKILHYIALGKQSGARLTAGGSRDTSGGNSAGYYVRPTIFAEVDNKSAIAQEEIFGPVLAITPFTSEQEVIELANDTIYGLAAGLWTADVSRAHRVANALDAGQVFINKYGCYDFASPFGGFKQSGWGKEMAIHSLDSYTRTKAIWLKL